MESGYMPYNHQNYCKPFCYIYGFVSTNEDYVEILIG